MFFNRVGKQASPQSLTSIHSKTTPVQNSSDSKNSETEGKFRRGALAVALAVQFALPFGMLNRAGKSMAQTAPTTGQGGGTTPAAPAAPPVAPAPVTNGEDPNARAALDSAVKYKEIQQQKDAYDAGKLVEKARTEQTAGRFQDALDDAVKATTLDPNNVQANTMVGELKTRLGLPTMEGQQEKTMLATTVAKQAIVYHVDASLGRADTDIAAKKWADALKDIDESEVWAKHDPTLFTQPEINDFNTRIQQARVRFATEKSTQQSQESEEAATDSAREQIKKAEEYQREKEKTIAGLVQDARQFTEESKFIEALKVVENIQRLDPNNAYAGGVRQFLEDRARNQEQKLYANEFNDNFNLQLNQSLEKQIPYADIIRYSPDWPKISEMRDQEVKDERGDDDEDANLRNQLEKHLPTLRIKGNSLSSVVDFLRDASGANIFPDWQALERANITRDTPVSLELHDVKFSVALDTILTSIQDGEEEHRLSYSLNNGIITISTKKELDKNTITRRYNIDDLLFVAPDYNNAPDLSLQNSSKGQSGGNGQGSGQGGGESIFVSTDANSKPVSAQDKAARIEDIKRFITENVDPNSWKENGGEVGTISSSPLRAVLMVTQTAEGHHKVQSILDSLRASQALQVSIETRFLIVQRNYLEDIGVNADFEFNPLKNPANARSGVNSSRFTPVSITQTAVTDNTTFRDANGNVVANSSQGARNLDWISNIGNAAVPGSIASNPADYPNPLVVSGSYVDNFTVTFLIRAVQANQNTTALTAPRLTLFSGQRALIVVQTQQAYVSGLTPVVAPGAALFDPTVQTTTATGVVLSVQATVSPDRKYVFLDIQPQLARLRALVPFTISAVVTPVNNVVTSAAAQVVQGTLQLPTIDLTIVRTSASVPDGATLLLGGQTLAAETTREQGVPVLSKIPFLKRLFTNRATSQDEQILLILVKPTILIQHEQEIKQFPQLSAK